MQQRMKKKEQNSLWKNETTTNTRVVVGQDEKIKKQEGRGGVGGRRTAQLETMKQAKG